MILYDDFDFIYAFTLNLIHTSNNVAMFVVKGKLN